MKNTIRALTIADTTDGVKLTLPPMLKRICVIPEDLDETLAIKFKEDDDYVVYPEGVIYDSGYIPHSIDGDVWVEMSDGSGVIVEYWT
jgi:hypothetical protein